MIEKTRLGAYLRAATENPTLVGAFGINVPRLITLTYGFGVALAALRRRAGGADLLGQPEHGRRPHHRRLRGGRDRRHGLDPRLDPHRLRARPDRGADRGLLPGGLGGGDLRHHGASCCWSSPPACSGGRPDGRRTTGSPPSPMPPAPAARGMPRASSLHLRRCCWRFGLVAPFVLYPVFLMKVLCFALFACAFNLLLGYGGLLSFGHAAFFGSASYVSAHAAKVWGLTPELAILLGTRAAALLGARHRRARHPPAGHLLRHGDARLRADGLLLLAAGALHRRRGRHPGGAARAACSGSSTSRPTGRSTIVVLGDLLRRPAAHLPHHPLALRAGAEGDPRERAARRLARLPRQPLQARRLRAVGHAGRASPAPPRPSSSSSPRSPTSTGRCRARSC